MVTRTIDIGDPGTSKLPKKVPVTTETGPPQPYSRALEERRAELDRIHSNEARQYEHHVTWEIRGPGEVTKELNFPVKYIRRPFMYFGGSLTDDTHYVSGNIPTVSAVVLQWITEIPNDGEDQMRIYYIGCKVGIVTTGPIDSKIWVDVHFTQVGLVNPVGGMPALDATL